MLNLDDNHGNICFIKLIQLFNYFTVIFLLLLLISLIHNGGRVILIATLYQPWCQTQEVALSHTHTAIFMMWNASKPEKYRLLLHIWGTKTSQMCWWVSVLVPHMCSAVSLTNHQMSLSLHWHKWRNRITVLTLPKWYILRTCSLQPDSII